MPNEMTQEAPDRKQTKDVPDGRGGWSSRVYEILTIFTSAGVSRMDRDRGTSPTR